jgi:hypothetical protein
VLVLSVVASAAVLYVLGRLLYAVLVALPHWIARLWE